MRYLPTRKPPVLRQPVPLPPPFKLKPLVVAIRRVLRQWERGRES